MTHRRRRDRPLTEADVYWRFYGRRRSVYAVRVVVQPDADRERPRSRVI